MTSATNNKLGIDQKEEAVDDNCKPASEWVPSLGETEYKHGEDAHHDGDANDDEEAPAEEGTAKLSKVRLGEPGVNSQRDGQHHGHECGHQNDSGIVVGTDDSNDKGPADSENEQEDVVHWGCTRDILAANESALDANCDDQGSNDQR